MQMNSTIYCDQQVGKGATSIGTSSVGALGNALLKLVNSASVTLNGNTTWGSVSAYIGGYQGYADDTITWQAPSVADAGNAEVLSFTSVFRPTGSSSPQLTYGIVITDPASANVLFAAPFDNSPIPMGNTNNTLQITLRWQPKTTGIVAVIS